MTCRTKIICTIGPSCDTYEMIVALIKAGMNVARLNFSHGTHEQHLKTIEILKNARHDLDVPLAIMLDTRGPEMRVGKIAEGMMQLQQGDHLRLVKEPIEGQRYRVSMRPGRILDNLPLGTRILFDDGYLSSRVVEIAPDGVVVEMENSGVLKSGKGMNIPDIKLDLPSVTESDIEDIKFGCQHGIDIIAASFVRTAENIIFVKNLLRECKCSKVLVIAKIENHEGVENFDSILQFADGVMIARGDLGVEIPLSRVPILQKEMIRKAYLAGKPSVTATQMLESMINNPRPTRAEVSDVANAIYDSTSAVMLSGETAVGKYPVQTVEVMKSIVQEAEQHFDYRSFFDMHSALIYKDVPSSVTLATVKTAYTSQATAIFAFTSGGSTARLLGRLRPEMPILAMTEDKQTYHQMAFNWGIIPVLGDHFTTLKEAFARMCEIALEKKFVSYGDLVIVTAGSTFGVSGTTNMMIVENIGDVLVRAHIGTGSRVYGIVKLLLFPNERIEPYAVRGQLIVITQCNASFVPYIKEAAGVILQNHIDDKESEEFLLKIAAELEKPAIIRADSASRVLKEGQLATLDPEKALVYKGVVL